MRLIIVKMTRSTHPTPITLQSYDVKKRVFSHTDFFDDFEKMAPQELVWGSFDADFDSGLGFFFIGA